MKKFVFVYYGGGDSAETSKEETDKTTADWGKWFEEMGSAIVDGGNPFIEGGQAVTAGGVSTIENMPATGYTIVNAEDMDAAVEMAKGNPIHKHTDGKAAVRVYEAMPM